MASAALEQEDETAYDPLTWVLAAGNKNSKEGISILRDKDIISRGILDAKRQVSKLRPKGLK